jgi:hypothetical protein
MFVRLIRVILSAEVLGFVTGINQARQLLGSFLSTVKSVMEGAAKLVGSLAKAFMDLPHLLDGVFEKVENFFGPALSRERGEAIFRSLTGSAEQAGEMMDFLREKSLAYGKSMEEILPSAQQIAVALRGANGEVDPAKWEQLTMAIVKFSTLRPDVPIQLWGRAISGLLSGDVTTLTRLLDIDVKSMGQLSEKVKEFLGGANQAREEQLGSVTRLGASAVADQETALQALDEIMEAVGATDDLLDETANTTQGKLDRLKAQWNDFVARVGTELLPILIEALDKLLAWINDHEQEITAFLTGLGAWAKDMATKIGEIDFEQLGADLAAAGEKAKEDWAWLIGIFEMLEKVNTFLNESYGKVGGSTQSPGSLLSPESLDPSGFGAEGTPLHDVTKFFENLFGGFEEARQAHDESGYFGPADQRPPREVVVRVEIDDEVLKARVTEHAGQQINELVENVTGGSSARNRHGGAR